MKQVPVIRKPTPRPYQMEARDNFLAGTGNMLIQLPTGTGKTLTSVIICEAYPGERVLFLAPTGTLVYQTCQAFMKNGLWPNVEKAEEYRGTPYLPDEKEWRKMFPGGRPPTDAFVADRVWVSTIQSFVDRVDKYRDQPFDLVVCDEAHRSLAKSWVKTVERLVSFNSSTRVLGLSATPYRGDKQNLGKLFPEFAYRMPIVKGIDDGWLVDVVCERAVLPGVDESMWKMGSGKGGGRDVTDESLAKSMNNRVCIEAIAHEVIERAGTRKGILFLPGVAVTESVSEALNALKPGCSTFIHGSVKPKRDNRRRVRMIEDGKVQFVCGCDALIEGFDVPDIALVVMARFTAQRGRYEQMLGRGLRVLAKSIEGLNTPAERKAAIAASAKPNCLLEGTMVLTDHGEIPIQLVTTAMKVWDGVDFVSHDGPIFNGVRPVITYAGLTATEDHRVWTESGWKTLGECRSSGTKIRVTGTGGAPIRETEGRVRGGCVQGEREQGTPDGGMHHMWAGRSKGEAEPAWWDCGLPEVWKSGVGSEVVVQPLPGCPAAVSRSEVGVLGAVWRQGNTVSVRVSDGYGFMDQGKPRSGQIEGDRSDRQRWPLRAGQHKARHGQGEHVKHPQAESERGNARIPVETPGCEVCGLHTLQSDSPWINVGADSSSVLSPQVQQTKGRVWDLLNAGPRNRFTAEGVLVSNCAVLDFANSSRFRLMSVEDILLDPTDEGGGKRAKERADFVRANRDPADKRAMREQLDILDSIYALQEAARKNAGPPPKLEWQYERANLFGYGGSVVTPTVGKKTDARRPTSEMVRQAEDLFVENAEGMTQGQLQAEIASRKERLAGKKGFGFLVYGCKIPPADVKRLRLNWHDAHYLRRLLKSSGRDALPGNWQDMVAKNRQQRLQGVANG